MLIALLLLQVKLELKTAAGEKSAHSWKESTTGRIVAVVAEQKAVENTLKIEVRKFRDEVLEVDGGAPTRVRRTIDEWTRSKELGGESAKETMKLQGRTLLLKRGAGDATEVEGGENAPPAELGKQRLRPVFFGSFPAEAVAVGQDWPIDEKILLKDFGTANDATSFAAAQGRGKLEKLENGLAEVSISVKASGTVKGQDALKISFDIRARVALDVAKGRLLSLKGEGEGKIEGTLDQNGEKIQLDGTFTLAIDSVTSYE